MSGEAITHASRDFTPDGAVTRPEICSCGHAPTPQPAGSIVGGYTVWSNNRTLCLDCAMRAELAAFNDPATTATVAYLTRRVRPVPPGIGERCDYALTTWTGVELAFVLGWRVQSRRTPSGGHYDRVYFNAIDAQGRCWHGTGQGVEMIARMRRRKTER